MATVNRFSNIQGARYNPRTFQDLMLAPSYMREQHDAVQGALGEAQGALYNPNSLDIHSKRVAEEQARIQEQIDMQAQQLSNEGFSPTSKGDFLRLNSDYQKSFSPAGVIGQAQSAAKSYSNNYEEAVKQGLKEGFSKEEIDNAWAAHAAAYNKSQAEGPISSINQLNIPRYKDFVAEVKDLMKNVGSTSKTLFNNLGNSEIVTKDPRGNYILTTKGHKKYKNNIQQVQGVLDYMTNQINNPNSEVGKSNQFRNVSPKEAIDQIRGLGDPFVETSEDSASGSTISHFKAPTPEEEAAKVGTGNKLIHLDDQALPSEFSYSDYKSNDSKLKHFEELETEGNVLSNKERAQYKLLKKFQANVNSNLENNTVYQAYKEEKSKAKAATKLGFDPDGIYWTSGGDNVEMQMLSAPTASVSMSRNNYYATPDGRPLTEEEEEIYLDYKNKVASIDSKLETIENNTTEDTSFKTSTYSIVPYGGSGDKQYKELTDALSTTLKYGNTIGNTFTVEGYENEDGTYIPGATNDEVTDIRQAIKRAKPGSIKPIGNSVEGINSGNPEVVVSFIDSGTGMERNVRLSYNALSGGGNNQVGNINNMMLNIMSSAGGSQGRDLAVESLKTIYSNKTWNDLNTEQQLDKSPILLSTIKAYMENDPEIAELDTGIEKLEAFMNKYGDKPVNFNKWKTKN